MGGNRCFLDDRRIVDSVLRDFPSLCLCLRQRRPLPSPMRYCTPIMSGGVGARWRAKAVTGEPITVEVVAGR